MAKILCNYFGLSMAAEGKSEFVGRQAAAFLGYVQQDAERCAENCGCAEDLSDAPEKIKREILRNDEELRRREQIAPGVEHDVVAIYDNAGIPSIMHRFRRVTNKELFGGSDAVHPAFIIGGEVYDEIYISVYENTMINGKPYSLPLQEPVTNITMEDFAQACFSKGEGWHCLTAAENNDAALPETDLTECGDGWKPITDAEGHPLYVAVEDNKITFNTYPSIHRDYCGCAWGNVRMNCDSEQLRALALFAGEEKAGCYVDSTEGEYILIRGGRWADGGDAGVFHSVLYNPRSDADGGVGGRSAYFKKH